MSKTLNTKVFLAGLLLVGLASCARRADLLLDPPEWSLGSIPSNRIARRQLSVLNRGPRPVELRFVSTCDCLQVDLAPAALASGEKALVGLSYDPQGQSGFVEAALVIVVGEGRGQARFALRVFGKILPYGSVPAL